MRTLMSLSLPPNRFFMRNFRALLTCLLGLPFSVFGQITLNINAIPANTPVENPIYLTGTFNQWNPGDQTYLLSSLGSGQYQIVIRPPKGALRFKFTRGNWKSAEANEQGAYLPDRTLDYTGLPITLNINIAGWEDTGSAQNGSGENVQLLSDKFHLPQLHRDRRIWVCLPADYGNNNKRYPVLYLQDGQNLFDPKRSASGEWEIDESMEDLQRSGVAGCIIVGIENGEQSRLDEYGPWNNPSYGGGQGDAYISFITNTLKPYIDANFRSIPDRSGTAIGGSSMGGLIAMYGFSKRQDIFSKALIFSPAFWFNRDSIGHFVMAHSKKADARVYFLCGGDEEEDGNKSDYVVQDMRAVADAMRQAGFKDSEKAFEVVPEGRHAEWFWAREFPEAYRWLFTEKLPYPPINTTQLQVFTDASGEKLGFGNYKPSQIIDYQIADSKGKLARSGSCHGYELIDLGKLSAGNYSVKAKKRGGKWTTLPVLLD